MELLTFEQQLYEKQQKGEYADCSFIFNTKDEENPEIVIHGHKIILSAASKYFETHFKAEWDTNSPILITTFNHDVFNKLLRAVYLRKIDFETLDEAATIYQAAHFYQMKRELDLLSDAMKSFCIAGKFLAISVLANTAWKYQDCKLIPFVSKYFATNAHKIIEDPDFMRFHPDVINWLYQHDDLSVTECGLAKALQKYLQTNESISSSMVESAIGAIRFLTMLEHEIQEIEFLTPAHKEFLKGGSQTTLNYTNFSPSTNPRYVKSFFSLLPSHLQIELVRKVDKFYCWVCREPHDVTTCRKACTQYPVYDRIEPLTKVNDEFHTFFEEYPATQIIEILKELENMPYRASSLLIFREATDILDNIYYV
ncbi:uncharacterized protein LOC134838462 [Culicoides brevitarsis]|uniref:uncharacterized protein LOC134838462 n=1 Tax=Culicoides brevitarsis TaxID=469753 RepID=UPI00307B71F2